ncbi:alpha/beta fold hydrolase [Psychromonas sp. MME2]|uniref:alpha/beta fold hydrolase n=1 Tax=unclassified Psychromonas TaxID=2614957 RepID=UPI00339CB9A3
MKLKRLVFIFTLLHLLYSAISHASQNMTTFKFSNENQLNKNFSNDINTFWDKKAESHYFYGVDNKKIHTVSIKSANNKVIVISQGRNESVLKYKEVAFDLYQQGYDLFLIDHRGQGFSERLGGDQFRGHVQNFQDYVTDLNQFIHSLDLQKHYQYRYLLAHSMGGTISALYLEQYPHPFQAASLFSPMLSINIGGIPNSIAKILTYSSAEICSWFNDKACYIFAGGPHKIKSFQGNDLTSSEVRFRASQNTFLQAPTTQLGSATMRWVAESISASEAAVASANNIKIPVLVIQAGDDSVVSASGQNDFFANMKNCKDKQLMTIDGAQHEILLESDPYRSNALNATLQFFSKSQQGAQTCIK